MMFSTLWKLADDDKTSANGPVERSRSEIVNVGVNVVRMIDGVSLKTIQ